ncbi:unnamed protein product [Merluccius merluccius]
MMPDSEMDRSMDPEAHMEDYKIYSGMPEEGDISEKLEWLKRRKRNLNFRRTVLMKTHKVRPRLPGVKEADGQNHELEDIIRELNELTAKQRELGYFEDGEDIMESVPELPTPPVTVDDIGVDPALTQCPSCGEIVTTKTVKKIGDAVWLLCFLSSVFGCVGGCCLIPFCLDRLKDIHHACPNCKKKIVALEKI